MRLSGQVALCLLAGTLSSALPAPQEQPDSTSLPTSASTDTAEASDQLAQLASYAQDTATSDLEGSSTVAKRGQKCTLQNVAVRREWGSLSAKERKAYTNAVLCLQSKPSKTPSTLIPGAKSRFDDWVGTHINQTMTIHYTGNFLAWHRYFTWQYEQALRNECGYTGTQPYWDWAKTAVTGLENSPILDGSDTSMSGNGEYIPSQGDIVIYNSDVAPVHLPTGTGGGCVTSGPFKNMSVNLGPVSLSLPGGITDALPDIFAYNPRCLKRDLTTAINRRFANATSVVNNILKPKEIDDFQMTMQGVPGTGEIGVHGGGHYSMGGDPGRDFFVSPSDPLFYLHHSNIDRTWWIWQQLDPKTRQGPKGISGTNTFLNAPPSANTTVDDIVDLGYAAGPPRRMGDLLSTTAGPFCYIYL